MMIRRCITCSVFSWLVFTLSISAANAWQIGNGAEESRQTSRALWVSSTADLLGDSPRRTELIQFCREQKIGLIWLQLLYDIENGAGQNPSPLCRIRYPQEFRSLLQEAHSASIQVQALDGYPEFVLAEYHAIPLAIMQSLFEFNDAGSRDERFDGVHFQNRPAELVVWRSRKMRAKIIQEFLLLNQKCEQLANRRQRFEFGIDIPADWHKAGEQDDETLANVVFDGKTQSLLQHCLDIADDVAIWNECDKTDGPNGLLARGEEILALPGDQNRPGIFLGVETAMATPARVWFALGVPRGEFELAAKEEANELLWRSRHQGYRLRTYDDGDNVHVGLEIPENQVFTAPGFQKVLRQIVNKFGVGDRAPQEIESMWQHAAESLQDNPDFVDAKQLELKIDGFKNKQKGLFARAVTRPEITFGDTDADHFDADHFEAELSTAEKAFSISPAFQGMAIHSFESARGLLNKTLNEKE